MSKTTAKRAIFEAKKSLGIGRAPNTDNSWEIVLSHFDLPHSGNPPQPFCEHGVVYGKNGAFYLGLQFVSGARFIYPNEAFGSVEAVVASMQVYQSASWATSPTGPEYDAGRFGPGTYRRVG